MHIVVHTDGGARGNPGPAAIGIVVEVDRKRVGEFGKKIGETTNNVAEYIAVIEALNYIRNQGTEHGGQGTQIDFYLDSKLVAQQLNGLFKVKDAKLRELLSQVRILEQEMGGVVRYHVIPRELNRRADFLVNQALNTREA